MAGALGTSAWWVLPTVLFGVCFVIGILAVPAGIGGGVLFVPIVAGFFPIHLDYVRATGLLVALAGALSASPRLIRSDLADLRLALPAAVIASLGAVAGALLGNRMPVAAIQVALGVAILIIFAVMALVPADHGSGERRRTPLGLALFAVIGLVAGLFGLGAGWGNVPVLNLVMGVPLKLAAGTSSLIMGFANSSAAWVFLGSGAVVPLVAVPSIVGVMLGARLGASLLPRMRATQVRGLVLALLFFAGVRMLAKGMGWWP